MDDPLKALADANAALYQQFVDENLAADRALIGGDFSGYLRVQAQGAREAIGDGSTDEQPAAHGPAAGG